MPASDVTSGDVMRPIYQREVVARRATLIIAQIKPLNSITLKTGADVLYALPSLAVVHPKRTIERGTYIFNFSSIYFTRKGRNVSKKIRMYTI